MENIFRAFLRLLLRDLLNIREALAARDYERADRLLGNLVEDIQEDIK